MPCGSEADKLNEDVFFNEKGKGRGKGKKRDGSQGSQGGGGSRDPPKQRGGRNASREPSKQRTLYCNSFLKTGKCDDPNCNKNHWNAAKVDQAKKLFGEKMQTYYNPRAAEK